MRDLLAHTQADGARTLQPHPAHSEDAGGRQHQARFGSDRLSWASVGVAFIEALIAGQTMPQALASLAHRRIHASVDELEASLRGRVTKHHRFLSSCTWIKSTPSMRPSPVSTRR